jgi:hypothetical protein
MDVTIPSSGVALEGIFWSASNEAVEAASQYSPLRVAVVCHPHPQYGGTMHNKVVFRAGRALQELGMAVLRFNFRGVGKSTGAYDFGHGEKEDVRAAIDYLHNRYPQAEVVLAGYSFGAWVGLLVGCQDKRVTQLVGIGTPVATNDFSFLIDCTKPKLFIHGTEDEFGSVEQMQTLLLSIPEPKELILIEGAEHFFNGKLEALSRTLIEHFER